MQDRGGFCAEAFHHFQKRRFLYLDILRCHTGKESIDLLPVLSVEMGDEILRHHTSLMLLFPDLVHCLLYPFLLLFGCKIRDQILHKEGRHLALRFLRLCLLFLRFYHLIDLTGIAVFGCRPRQL